MPDYPIHAVVADFLAKLENHSRCIVSAAPGAGKTTVLPLKLLSAPWRGDGRILVLEPRRLAVYAAACRLAENLGENVGETVGYRMRLENRVGPRTRIELVTEGILTRMLQDDPELNGVSAVIFDEFHERTIHGDTALALALDAQDNLRPDLKIIIMSATLDIQRLSEALGAPAVVSEGRSFPVEIFYRETSSSLPLPEQTAGVIQRALEARPGSLLAFLPGEGPIRRTAELLRGNLAADVELHELYGRLDKELQRRAIAPAPAGKRKIVLATSIAETSLTIEGVKIVVDSGLTRSQTFSPVNGLTKLETVPISLASAEQRRGRAGRIEPGVCYRLWTQGEEKRMPEFTEPEILHSDLAPLALELAAWGIQDPNGLFWLDPPPQGHWRQAIRFLTELGAITTEGRLTDTGRNILKTGLEPRLGCLLFHGEKLGLKRSAAELAALLSEYDVRGGDSPDIRALLGRIKSMPRVLELANRLGKGSDRKKADDYSVGLLLAFAYPDRIARLRPSGGGRFVLSSGRSAILKESSPLAREPYLVAAELDAGDTDARIYLAAPLAETDFLDHFLLRESAVLYWDEERKLFRSRLRRVFGKLVVGEKEAPLPDGEAAAEAVLELIRERGLDLLPWTDELRRWCDRMNFIHRHRPEFPDFSAEILLDELEHWLKPFCPRKISGNFMDRIDLGGALKSRLSYRQTQEADALAPERFTVPTGSNIRIDYSADPPVLPVRLQEMFGCRETPRIMNDKVGLLLHLLSPAMRPVQITADLAGFWQNSYQYVKSDLKGRYPKHDWPDDPANATPQRGAKKRNFSK